MKEIKFYSNGNIWTTKVSDEDYEKLRRRNWYINKRGNKVCPITCINGKLVRMHKLILSDPGRIVDHINGDGLDNQRENLRYVTNSQNLVNRSKTNGNFTSKYKGVCKDRDKFRASIEQNGISIYIGLYPTEIQAAKAYNRKAKELFGEYANLNSIEEGKEAEKRGN